MTKEHKDNFPKHGITNIVFIDFSIGLW